MTKKFCCVYANCQADGLVHFLKKTIVGEHYDFAIWHNWQLILREQDPAGLMRDAARADLFIYQPAGAIHEALSTDHIIEKVLSADCPTISFAYAYNHGFFPFLKAADGFDGWVSGSQFRQEVRDGIKTGSEAVLRQYHYNRLFYGCARRFLDCLQELSHRESGMNVQLARFILDNYKTHHLFLSENHPTSTLFLEIAAQVTQQLGFAWNSPAVTGENEANMNGSMPLHQAVVDELGLKFGPDPDAHAYYHASFERMLKEKIV